MDGGGAERSSRGLSKSCVILIVIGGMERFVFKGVASNLVTYLTDTVGLTNSSAAKMVNSWCGFTSIMPLLLAPLADSYWDRFSTILVSAFLYLLGLVALTWTALVGTGTSSLLLFWSLCVVSVGQGGYNPSLQALGTDQLDTPNPAFFRMWYMGICSGSLLGITLMSYIQDTFGWVVGFAIPTLTMLASILVFLCATPLITYVRRQDTHNPIQTIVNVIKAAATRLKAGRITLPDDNSHVVELELEEKPLCSSGQSVDKESSSEMFLGEDKNYKVILRLLPIWTMLLMFAVIFQQPPTFFTKQGMTMERSIGGGGLKIPPATLQSAITISIILLMPLYDVLIVPFARLITGDERGLSVMQRMGVGMFLSIVSMVFAALVETKRLEASRDKSGPLSILWLLPQYILLGMADTFTVVGMQEFFYSEVPIRMRTMGFALYTSVFGMGSFLSAILISLLEILTTSSSGHNWFSNDMTKARLDRYYWLLATLSTLSLLFYAILCKYHKTRSQLDSEDTT